MRISTSSIAQDNQHELRPQLGQVAQRALLQDADQPDSSATFPPRVPFFMSEGQTTDHRSEQTAPGREAGR